ncbi:MAG: hypothetical protein KZQ78_13470, partial [Candidatus Thiodiazotropha sp. (ex Ustalcina ferruginea)]|nr:hypothetical protein [Candidatus Thiodiazotropha sp. (ex Ustalcina ferruginea)]
PISTFVMLFFGALVCFAAGVKIALMAGLSAFIIGNVIAWLIARVTYATGFSNTLITRKYGLCHCCPINIHENSSLD